LKTKERKYLSVVVDIHLTFEEEIEEINVALYQFDVNYQQKVYAKWEEIEFCYTRFAVLHVAPNEK